MPFVKRDAEGNISAVFNKPIKEGAEEIRPNDPELVDFLHKNHPESAARRDFVESDLALARVLEDLIDLLIDKGAFRFTDLPEAAQTKLLARRGLRKEFAYMDTLFALDEEDFTPDGGEGGNGFL